MAITEKPFFNPWDTPNVDVEEIAIGGKLLTTKLEITQVTALQHWDDETWRKDIRMRMVRLLADRIIQDNYCEITSHEDFLNGNKILHARCYLAPNEQVKILRSLKR